MADAELAALLRAWQHRRNVVARAAAFAAAVNIVHQVAGRYARRGFEWDELVADGYEALLLACDDPGAMIDFYSRAFAAVRSTLRRRVRREYRDRRCSRSLDAHRSRTGEAVWMDLLASAATQETEVERAQVVAGVRLAVAHAVGRNPRLQVIARHRALAAAPETLAEVGARLGVTAERVRQLEAVLHERLRRYLLRMGFGPEHGSST